MTSSSSSGISPDASVVDISVDQDERGYGTCSTCRWTVFVVNVEYRPEDSGFIRTETFEGTLTEFFAAVTARAAPEPQPELDNWYDT